MADLLPSDRNGPARLRALLAGPEPVLAPGAYDALSARLIEQAGFPAVYLTGFGIAASVLGRPDIGLVTLTEMADAARRLVRATSLPIIADADTGYGNAIGVVRAVQEYEAAGVAAIQLEDQISPKKCAHMEGKRLVPTTEMTSKVRAAVAARASSDFVVVARTDARSVEGIGAAIERARRYRDEGADVLFVEAPETEEEIEQVADALRGTPLLFNWAEGAKTPPVSIARLRDLGFRIVIFPVGTLLASTAAIRRLLAIVRAEGTPIRAMEQEQVTPFNDFLELIGLGEIQALEERFGV
jgi:2-methylisocitrate lyase-like PEP mutase family enzyme